MTIKKSQSIEFVNPLNTYIINVDFLATPRDINSFSFEEKIKLILQLKFYCEQGLLFEEVGQVKETFRILALDYNNEIRNFLAVSLKDLDNISHEIAIKIARDNTLGSLAFLTHSPMLTNSDLLELIESSLEETKFIAISKRRNLDPLIMVKLIESKISEVLFNLIKNKNVILGKIHYQHIFTNNSSNEPLISLLLQRDEYSKDELVQILQKLPSRIHDAIFTNMSNIYSANSQTFCSLGGQTIQHSRSSIFKESQQKIDNLFAQNRLFHIVLFKFLCKGDIDSFLYGITKLSDVSLGYIQDAVALPVDRSVFKKIYLAAQLPAHSFEAVDCLVSIFIKQKSNSNKPNLALIEIKAKGLDKNVPEMSFFMKLLAE